MFLIQNNTIPSKEQHYSTYLLIIYPHTVQESSSNGGFETRCVGSFLTHFAFLDRDVLFLKKNGGGVLGFYIWYEIVP